MTSRSLFLCLVVVVGAWAKSSDGGDLNLKSIFRTPRDFSKVNFDHFEILERNNFDDSSAAENSETAKAEDKRSKSMANAQVMLRIGGEDIHDCNRVILHHQAAAKDNNLYSEHQQPSYNNQLRYPYFPHPYNAYPYFHHQPYSFPGYYFNPNPLSNYLPSSYQTYNNQLVPTELATKSPESVTTITLLEEGQNLCHTTEAQTEACTESPKSQVILDKPNPYDNQIKKTEIVHAPCEPCAQVEEKMCAINTEPTQTSVMDTTCANMVTEGISLQEYSTASPICTSTTHSESLPSKMEYVEVNVENVEKCRDEAPKDDTTGTLVEHNKESVPDHKSQRSPVLMSHEVVEEKTVCTTPQEQVVVTDAPSGNHDALCHPCNCESGSKNPHGHRFSKNVDSLQEIADNSLYNEELSESRLNIPLESRKVETVSNAHEDSQSQCSTHHVVTNHCPQKEVVEVINPGHETIQVTQEVVQGGNSCPESPCETKTVIAERNDLSEFSTVVPAVRDGHIEWSTQNACTEPSHPREVTVINPYHGTTEGPCATKEVIHVSSPRPKYLSSPLCDQTEWLFKKIISSNIPQRKPAHKPCHQSSFYEEEVHVDNPHHEVVKQPYYTKEVRVQKHPLYFSGYNSKSDSQLSVDYFRHGNAHPKVYVDGYESSSGSGYYSDPVKSVTYRQPFIVDTFKVSNPRIPFIEHVKYVEPDRTVVETYHSPHSTNCYREHVRFHPFSELLESYKYSHPVTPIRHHAKTLEPHIYRIVPKYDIIPRGDIKSLNIPDLVPTNQYLKINVPHRPPVCHRDFAHANKAPVVRNEYYVRKSQPSWRNVSVQKEASLTPGCTKYKGELDEHC